MTSPSPLAGEGKLSRSDSRERGRRISKLRGRAKEMRSDADRPPNTDCGKSSCEALAGYKFHRQLPIDFYIADFVCLQRRLIVEADGGQHCDEPR